MCGKKGRKRGGEGKAVCRTVGQQESRFPLLPPSARPRSAAAAAKLTKVFPSLLRLARQSENGEEREHNLSVRILGMTAKQDVVTETDRGEKEKLHRRRDLW